MLLWRHKSRQPDLHAFWAIADQKAGGPLGQAAPIASTLNNYHLTDVTSYTPGTQAAGSITDSGGTTTYTDASLFAGNIYGAKDGPGRCSRSTTRVICMASWLWPSVWTLPWSLGRAGTMPPGYGTPNGLPFILGAAAAK